MGLDHSQHRSGSSSEPAPPSRQSSRPSHTRSAGTQRPRQYSAPGWPAHSCAAEPSPSLPDSEAAARTEQPGGSSEPSEQSASPSQYKLCTQTFRRVSGELALSVRVRSERAAALTLCRQSALAAQRKEPGAQAQLASSSPVEQSGVPSQRAAAGTQAPSPHASVPAPHAPSSTCPARERSVTYVRSADLPDGECSGSHSLQGFISSDASEQSTRPSQRHAMGMHTTAPFVPLPPHWNCSFVQPRTGCSSKVSPS